MHPYSMNQYTLVAVEIDNVNMYDPFLSSSNFGLSYFY